MSVLDQETRNDLIRLAERAIPYETCGLLFKRPKDGSFVICETANEATMKRWEYTIPAIDQARLLDHYVHQQHYEWWGIWHSHPNEGSKCWPSPKDRVEAAYDEIHYVIVQPRTREVKVFTITHEGEFDSVEEVTQ